jgi:anti-sigma regulatory factor (Ser/Thr protein kinase)/serine/threonine protein phosphatase PrpC
MDALLHGDDAGIYPKGGPASLLLPVEDATRVGEARRAAVALAERLGLGEDTGGRLALVVTELATNLARHAREGMLLLRATEARDAVEVLSLDRGPGIADLGSALADGYSTGGTRGAGLGAIRRVAQEFDAQSGAGVGSAIVVRVGASARQAQPSTLGAVCVPYPGETHCGDAWLVRDDGAQCTMAVIDGLGHGASAAVAAHAAREEVIRRLAANPRTGAAALLEAMHGALRSTRGAAASVAAIDRDAGTLDFAGIGNVAGAIVTPGEQRALVSHNGILGHQVRKVQAFSSPWPRGGILVLHSDGLSMRWRADQYPGLATRDPALLAGVLYRDHARGRDDATVIAIRPTP